MITTDRFITGNSNNTVYCITEERIRIAENFNLGYLPGLLKSFTNNNINFWKVSMGQTGERLVPVVCHDNHLVRCHQHDRVSSCTAMSVSICPWSIKGDTRLFGGFDHRHLVAKVFQVTDNLGSQCGFATIVPTDKRDNGGHVETSNEEKNNRQKMVCINIFKRLLHYSWNFKQALFIRSSLYRNG